MFVTRAITWSLLNARTERSRDRFGFKCIWGDALAEMHRAGTDVRIINLETSITRSNDSWPDKGIHFRAPFG